MRRGQAGVMLGLMLILVGSVGQAGAGDTGLGPPLITLQQAWVRRPSPMAEVEQGSHGGSALHPDQTAVYMTIHNHSHESDILLGASSAVATTAVFHTLLAQDGTLVMHPHGPFEVPASGRLALHPGGAHIMLLGLTQALKPGETVPVVLTFQQAGSLSVDAVVK